MTFWSLCSTTGCLKEKLSKPDIVGGLGGGTSNFESLSSSEFTCWSTKFCRALIWGYSSSLWPSFSSFSLQLWKGFGSNFSSSFQHHPTSFFFAFLATYQWHIPELQMNPLSRVSIDFPGFKIPYQFYVRVFFSSKDILPTSHYCFASCLNTPIPTPLRLWYVSFLLLFENFQLLPLYFFCSANSVVYGH